MTAEELRRSFAPAPGLVYLDSATYGLPPQAESSTRLKSVWINLGDAAPTL
jgi:hypothetical protein